MSRLLEIYHSKPIYRQFVLYAIFGAISSALDFTVFTLLNHFTSLEKLWANAIGVVCGMVCSFFLNYFINFRSGNRFFLRFLSFLIVGSIGLGFSELIMHLGANTLQFNPYLTKFLSIILVALLQFGLNKVITFKEA